MYESAVFVLTCAFVFALAIAQEKPNEIEENINGTDFKRNITIPVWNVIADPESLSKKNFDTIVPIQNTTSSSCNTTTPSWNISDIPENTILNLNETNPRLNFTIPERNNTGSSWNNSALNWNVIIIFPVNTTMIPARNVTGSIWNITLPHQAVSFIPVNTSITQENSTMIDSNVTNPSLRMNNTMRPWNSTILILNNTSQSLNLTEYSSSNQTENPSTPMPSKNINTYNLSKNATKLHKANPILYWNKTNSKMTNTNYIRTTTASGWNNTTPSWNLPLVLLKPKKNSNTNVQRIKTTTNPTTTWNWNYFIKLE